MINLNKPSPKRTPEFHIRVTPAGGFPMSSPKPSLRRPARKKTHEKVQIPIPGRRPVEELLLRGIRPEVLLVGGKEHRRKEESLLTRCRSAGWKVEFVERSDLDRAAEGLNHQGLVAMIRDFPYLTLDELISHIQQVQTPLLVALDQVQDVGNLGAILRSAECAGVNGAIIPVHRSARITAAVIRRSAGAALHLPICRTTNLSRALDVLIEGNMKVIGADQEGTRSLYETDLRGSTVIVVGSEDRGLRPGIKRRCRELVSIPLQGKITSLNASAAAAVCLFEALRQRSRSG